VAHHLSLPDSFGQSSYNAFIHGEKTKGILLALKWLTETLFYAILHYTTHAGRYNREGALSMAVRVYSTTIHGLHVAV
jgi:hypothetical protein